MNKYLKTARNFLRSKSRQSYIIFWAITLIIGFISRQATFADMHRNDLLVSNELTGMDMENFLNWARIMEEKDRWLSDFSISDKSASTPIVHSTYHQAPLYPYLLGWAARLFNVDMDYGATKSNYDITIGENLQAPGRAFHGLIDDIRLYGRAVSLNELRNHIEDGKPGPKPGLIGHWPLDHIGPFTNDMSGYHQNAKSMGNPSAKPDKAPINAKNHASVEFDGDDHLRLMGSGNRIRLNHMTVSCWIKVNSFTKEYQTIIAQGDESWRIARNKKTNRLQFAVAQGGAWVNGKTNVNDGKWHFVVGIYNGENIYLYVDGKLEGKKEHLAGLGKNSGYLKLLTLQQLLGLLMLWPLHEILHRLGGLTMARIGTFLFLFSQLSVFYELMFLRNTLISCFYLFLIHNLILLQDRKTLLRAFLVGIFLGLSWMCKPTIWVFIPFFVLWLTLHKKKEQKWKNWGLNLFMIAFGTFLMMLPFIQRNNEINKRRQDRISQLEKKAAQAEIEHKRISQQGTFKANDLKKLSEASKKFKKLNNEVKKARDKENLPLFKFTTRGKYAVVNGNSYLAYELPGTSLANPGSSKGLGWDILRIKNSYLKDPATKQDYIDGQKSLLNTIAFVANEHSEKESWLTHFLPMQWNKFRAFFNAFELPNNTNLYLTKKYSTLINYFFIDGMVICTIFVVGLLYTIKQWKDPIFSLLYGFILIYAAITIAFYFIGRFRFPVIPLMYIIGIAGIAKMLPHLKFKYSLNGSLTWGIIVLSLLIAWPQDVRGGKYSEAFNEFQGLRLNDYHNYSQSKAHRGCWDEMLNISYEGLSKKEGEENRYLWDSFFGSVINLNNTKDQELIDKKIELLKRYRKKIHREHPHLNFNNLKIAAYFSYTIDQLYAHAAKTKDKANAKIYAKRGYQLTSSKDIEKVHKARQDARLIPIYSVKVYEKELGIKKEEPKKTEEAPKEKLEKEKKSKK